MEAAQIDGIPLFGKGGARSSGAIFTLASAATKTVTARVGSRWTVDVAKDSDALVVRGGRARSHVAAWRNALEAGHRALDILSVRGIADLSIHNADEDYVVWWSDGSRFIIRLFAVTTQKFSASATFTVRDASGKNVRQQRTKPVWHESFRFFRLAQVTDDLLDAYRNLYLALECLVDDRWPMTAKESEKEWLRRALAPIHAATSLASLAPANSKDPVVAIVEEIYSLTRTAVFHAKFTRPHLTPGDRVNTRQVRENLERLARLYLIVATQELDSRRASSGLTRYAFNRIVDGSLGSMVLAVSDDGAAFDPADTVLNPSGGVLVHLMTRPAPEYDQPFVRNWLGSIDVPALSGLSRIARLGGLNDGTVAFAQVRENIMTVGGFDVLEAHVAYRVENQGPRRLYPR